MAFKTEELSAQIFPVTGEGLWACPESTIIKKEPCPQSTHVPCPDNTHPCPENTVPPDGGNGGECPESTIHTHPPGRASGSDGPDLALSLLQGQLRERLAQESGT